MANQDSFYTAAEAAKKFGVDRRTISRWVESGKIKAVLTAGGHLRILRSEIDNLLDKNGFAKFTPLPKKILIVDDDELVRKTLEQKLTRHKFTIETASGGFEAGLKAREMSPDLIILDLMMDGVDGFEVCRTIKNSSALRKTKILIMTGFDTAENRERALREGADDYLPKGISLDDVLKGINKLLAL